MALKKTINFRGVEVQDAYIRVAGFDGNKTSLRITVSTHANADGPALEAQTFVIPYNVEGKGPIAQAYDTIKVWPEFAGAADC